MIPLAAQLACARRELAIRRNVYPSFIKSGRMTKEESAKEIAAMESICATLDKLRDLEAVSEEIRGTIDATLNHEHTARNAAVTTVAPVATATPPAPPADVRGSNGAGGAGMEQGGLF